MNPEALQRVAEEMPAPPVVAEGASVWERWQAFTVRRRTLFSLLVIVPLVVIARPTLAWYLTGVAFILVGICLRIVASGYLIKSAQLTVGGPFAHMRHPLYVASSLIAMGCCAMSGRWLAFPIVAGLFVAVYGPTVAFEERFLGDKFGDAYREYRARVPAVLPRLRPPPGSWSGFRWALVLFNKEHVNASGVAAIVLGFAARLLMQ
jgi:protein-S-isoprenylcysteine O-methyltransferase Ste14